MTQNINHKCPDCDNGVIVVAKKVTKAHITYDVKKCNGCKKEYGLKAVSKFKLISNDTEQPN